MTKPMDEQAGITIREAGPADVARVVSLIMLGAAEQTVTQAEIAAEALHPDYARAFARITASPDSTLFVAERDGEVIGTFQVTLIPGLVARGRTRAKFESVHVAPECRGQGIGAIMMRFALAFAAQRGAGLAELTSHRNRPEAHRFYRNLGFDQSHQGFKKML